MKKNYGKSDYSQKLLDPRWQRKRLEVMSRDEFKCVACSDSKNTLHVHHTLYEQGDPWDTDSRFLVTLCAECHSKMHSIAVDEIRQSVLNFNMAGITDGDLRALSVSFLLRGNKPGLLRIITNLISREDFQSYVFELHALWISDLEKDFRSENPGIEPSIFDLP